MHAVVDRVDQQPGGGGSQVERAVGSGHLKVAGEEYFLTDAFGPGADGQLVAHGGETVKIHFEPRQHPDVTFGQQAVIIEAQAGGVGIGGFLKSLKDGGRLPAVVDVGFVRVYPNFSIPD